MYNVTYCQTNKTTTTTTTRILSPVVHRAFQSRSNTSTGTRGVRQIRQIRQIRQMKTRGTPQIFARNYFQYIIVIYCYLLFFIAIYCVAYLTINNKYSDVLITSRRLAVTYQVPLISSPTVTPSLPDPPVITCKYMSMPAPP